MRPPTTTEMRSASENTASMSCSIKRIVYCPFTLANSFDIARDSSMPKPAIGSSSSSMIGWVASAMPSSSCRCWPCDILDAMTLPRRGKATAAVSLRAGPRRRANPPPGRPKRKKWDPAAPPAGRRFALGGEAVEDARDLERSRQPEPRAAGGRQLGDVAPVEDDPPRIRLELAGQLSDQRGLAGAVGTDEGMGFALADAERHVVGGEERTKRLAQVLDLQQEFAHLAAPGLESAARSSASGKSTLGSPSLSSAPVARTSMPQMPSFTSSTRATSSGPKNSIQCSVKSDSTSRKARKNAAPRIGPIRELAEPRITIASNSPDNCQ